MKGRIPVLPSMLKSSVLGTDEMPTPPEWLEGVALREWYRCCDLLEGKQILSPIDQSALANYCVVYAQWLEVKDIIRIEGMFQRNLHGLVVPHPAVNMSINLSKQLLACSRHFGFSPSDRKKLGVSESNRDDDELSNF